ncbi:MAG TPA: hypothetical protein VHV30_18090, partial [Polyangiaceae bacterium]|nr:hypothetical protein [Polyangiaceae bacterium]
MAALTTPDAKADARGPSPAERLRFLRALGASSVPTWAAIDRAPSDGASTLVVADRVRRAGFSEADLTDWIRDARHLMALEHPNVPRVRGVLIRADEVLVVTDFADGVRWSELASTASLESSLRVLVDVLTGLNALHNLRDAKRAPLKLLHGALAPDQVLVGLDGVTRLLGS